MQKSLKHNMGYGYIPEKILSFSEIKESFINSIDKKNEENYLQRYLNYNTCPGDIEVRKTISKFFLKQSKIYMNPNNIQITYGNTFGLLIALQATLSKGDKVLVEVPTFFNAITQIQQANYDIIPVERRSDGNFDLDELEKLVIEHDIKGFYTVASNSNPLGVSISFEQRVRLYHLSKKHKFYIYSDDIYELLNLDESDAGIPIFFCDEKVGNGDTSHLLNYDNDSNEYIIYMVSFNKLVCPQLKVGFNLVHSSLIKKFEHLAVIKANGFGFSQHLLRSYIELGHLEKMIEKQKIILKNNRDVLFNELSKCEYLEINKPSGGFFMFVRVKESVDVSLVHKKREEYELNFLDGFSCGPADIRKNMRFNYLERFIRLSFSSLNEEELLDAGKAFVNLITNCLIKN
jgi:DNA-binding transcriptional MocR family regulator